MAAAQSLRTGRYSNGPLFTLTLRNHSGVLYTCPLKAINQTDIWREAADICATLNRIDGRDTKVIVTDETDQIVVLTSLRLMGGVARRAA